MSNHSKVKLGLPESQLKWLTCAVENARKNLDQTMSASVPLEFKRANAQGNWYWIDAQFTRFFLALPKSVIPENKYRIKWGRGRNSKISISPTDGRALVIELEVVRNAIVEVLDNATLTSQEAIDQFTPFYEQAMAIWDQTRSQFSAGAQPDGQETDKP